MKAYGIVRRVDDLGRVVIPKEIRRNYNIKEGDALEITTSREGILLTPCSSYLEDTERREWADKVIKKYENLFTSVFVVGKKTTVVFNDGVSATAVCKAEDTFDYAVGVAVALCHRFPDGKQNAPYNLFH